jgi:hypothetical protein
MKRVIQDNPERFIFGHAREGGNAMDHFAILIPAK